jgi:hypothetical protein
MKVVMDAPPFSLVGPRPRTPPASGESPVYPLLRMIGI